MATAPTSTLIVDVSVAARLTALAVMMSSIPATPSPAMKAATSTAIRFSVLAPAPAPPTPTTPPATAAEPATTIAAMVCRPVAWRVSAPVASTLVSSR